MATLTSSGTFTVTDLSASTTTTTTTVTVAPAVSFPTGRGRLVHPTLGVYDYDYKPDEWVGIDADVIIPPTWAATKTLQGSSHSLWYGDIADQICQESWLSLGGAAMPVSQLRMFVAMWTAPVDPSVGYVQWFPNYVNSIGYNVFLVDVIMGSPSSSQMARMNGVGSPAMVFDDVIHTLDAQGNPDGWVTKPVTLFLKIVSRING